MDLKRFLLLLPLLTVLFTIPSGHAVGISIDGSAGSSGCVNNHADAILTTVSSNDLIVADYFVASQTATTTVTDTAGLSWTKRIDVVDAVSSVQIFEFTAKAPSALTSDNVSISNSAVANCNTTAFGVFGPNNKGTLFDPAMPVSNTGKSSVGLLLNVTASNLSGAEMVVGFGHNQGTCSAGSGFTLVKASSGFCAEYSIIQSSGSVFVSIPTSAGTEWQILADGIFQSPPVSQNTNQAIVVGSSILIILVVVVAFGFIVTVIGVVTQKDKGLSGVIGFGAGMMFVGLIFMSLLAMLGTFSAYFSSVGMMIHG